MLPQSDAGDRNQYGRGMNVVQWFTSFVYTHNIRSVTTIAHVGSKRDRNGHTGDWTQGLPHAKQV